MSDNTPTVLSKSISTVSIGNTILNSPIDPETPTSRSSRAIFKRRPTAANVVLICAAIAMTLQLWTFRGGMKIAGAGGTTYWADCRQYYEMIQDVPAASTSTAGDSTKLAQVATNSEFPLPRITKEPLVVIVLTRRGAFTVRTAIRQTWAQHHDNVYFVIGQGCTIPTKYRGKDEGGNGNCAVAPRPLPDEYFEDTLRQIEQEEKVTQQLLEEQAQHQDMLLMKDIDMYRTLPAKLKYAYTFVDKYLPDSVQWVLKVDDDFFVRIDKFQEHLLGKFGDVSTPIMVGGDIRTAHAAHVSGKWKEVPQWRHGALYPPFPLGSFGHAVTRPIAHYVAANQRALFDYQGEDVSIGIWLSHPSAPKNITFANSKRMENNGNCRDPEAYVVGHDLTTAKMSICDKIK